MESWTLLIDILILLTAALLLGTLAEQFRQSAIVGYLIAGAVVGPNVLGWVHSAERVELIAELGIALLLFTIGLEFSFRRLWRMGSETALGGSLQILITAAIVGAAARMLGFGIAASVTVGLMVALSSTASVLRLLIDRAALESPYGRTAMGVLLLQDVAVLPATLLVEALSKSETAGQVAGTLVKSALFAALLVLVFLGLFNYIVPKLLNIRRWAANRELPILLAIVVALGSAAAAHEINISPAIGAFLAGVMLAESPFASQIRADVASLRTLFVTLFFASMGMLSDPIWVAANWHWVTIAVVAVLVIKGLIAWAVLVLAGGTLGMSLAAGLCLAQIGEFSFVLASIAHGGNLISEEVVRLIVSVTVLTLLLTPYLVELAPHAAQLLGRLRLRREMAAPPAPVMEGPATEETGDRAPPLVLIVGFGPAGQRIVESLLPVYPNRIRVIDLNPRAARMAQRYGLHFHIGNAAHPDVLIEAGISAAEVVVVTVPDPAAARQAIHLCRELNPNARLVVRARYHAYRWELQLAGAEIVVDEEEHIGRRLAAEVRRMIRALPLPEEDQG